MKTIFFLTAFLFLVCLDSNSQTFNEIKKLIASDDASGDEHGFAVDIHGDYAVVGARGNDDNGANSGSIYVHYRNQGGQDNWGEVKKLNASDGAFDDQFGFDVTIHGDNIAVGVHKDDDNGDHTGAVYMFNKNQGGLNNWGQVKKIKASDPGLGKAFGLKVELYNDILVVGANEHFWYRTTPYAAYWPIGAGAAYVFYQNQGGANNWGQVKKVTPSDGVTGDGFGFLDIDGDYLVVSSHYKNSYQGAVYIFHKNQGGTNNWGQVKKIVPPISPSIPTYGLGISVSGDNLAVGSYYESGGGYVYVYNRNQGGTNNWGQVKKFKGSTVSSGYWFGTSVSMENDILVVGAAGNGSSGGDGQAYVFKQNQGGTNNWGQTQILTASDGAYNDQFGFSLAINQGRIIVGATQNDDGGANSGSAYVFANCVSTAPTSVTASVNPICQGNSTTLTLVGGYLGAGATWEWYSGSCGGTSVGSGTSISVSPASNTTYYVRAEGSCNTTSCASLLVNVTVPQVANNTTNTSAICESSSKTLSAIPSGGTWSVLSGGGTISGTTYTPGGGFIGSSKTVTIRYSVAANGPCPATTDDVAFTVHQDPGAALNTTNSSDMCGGQTKTLVGSPSGGTWSLVSIMPGGIISGNTFTANTVTTSTGVTIRYTIAANGSCSSSFADVTFNVQPVINPSASASEGSLCENSTRVLSATPSGGTWNILSGPGLISGGVLTPNGTGTVVLEYAVTGSCVSGADTVDVIINPSPNASAGLDENICAGDTATLIATGGGTYQWSPGPAMASQEVYPVITTGYRVDITSDSGCIESDSLTVFVVTPGIVDAQDDPAVVITGTEELVDVYSNDIGSINSIQIINGPLNGIGVVNGANIEYTSTLGYIGNDTIEYLICDDICGTVCDTAFVYLSVDNDLMIPIGVSVNGDGKNDVFNVLGLNRYPNNNLKIFNRWGSLMFEAQPYLNDWDGKSTSGEVIEGTYFYILDLGNDLPARKGYIELKK